MNILAVGAHPDDVETMCAGTLAKYAAQGHKVFIATATNGNIGSAHHTMEEIGRIRKQEAANSAAIIGAEYICLDYDLSLIHIWSYFGAAVVLPGMTSVMGTSSSRRSTGALISAGRLPASISDRKPTRVN